MVGLLAQDVPPPKAEPVPEEEVAPAPAPAPPAVSPADPKAPPKVEVVPEDGPPPEVDPPDAPWAGDKEARAEYDRKKEGKPSDEKAAEGEKPKKAEVPDTEEVKEVKAVPNDTKPLPAPFARHEPRPDKPKTALVIKTDPNAKPLSLKVPAPRGLIVDRNGQPLAQNKMGHYIGVQLPMKEGLTDVKILDFARGPIAFCQAQIPDGWDVSDAEIIQHYHKRRWVPLMCSSLLPDERAVKLKDSVPPGVVLKPFFLRTYPEHNLAGHILGYMGKSAPFMPSNLDLEAGEQMWPPTVGRSGLEKRFDKELTGEPGQYDALFDSKGDMLSENWESRPRAGHTVVTTLDMDMQKIAERNLKERRFRGSFIILDVKTGDILAMASTPCIDPNDWVYGVTDEFYAKQLVKPDIILTCRAIQGLYPPASTFKIVTACAALETDKIGPDTEFNCPSGMYFNNQWMSNHTKHGEGMMDVERAIMRSCNTWFYQVSQICGGAALADMGIRFGFGEKTGICLEERTGRMPTPEYYRANRGSMTKGTLANCSIGQGDIEATPLQVARMMMGIARGDTLPKVRLVKTIQDVDGRIVQHFPVNLGAPLGVSNETLEAVRRGMLAVVEGAGGTGSQASNKYVTIVGKTGTGEWHPKISQNVAWFGGFIPYKEPEYAFACFYEGDPGDKISGGGKVAPVVGDVFNEIYKAKKKNGEIKESADDGDDRPKLASRARRAQPVEEVRPAQPVATPEPPKRGGLFGWFRRQRAPEPPPAQPMPSGRPRTR
jgi:penicillin-binding protein 2